MTFDFHQHAPVLKDQRFKIGSSYWSVEMTSEREAWTQSCMAKSDFSACQADGGHASLEAS